MFTLIITLIIGDATGTQIERTLMPVANAITCEKVAAHLSKHNRAENLYRQARAGLKPIYIRQYNCVPYAYEPPKTPEVDS